MRYLFLSLILTISSCSLKKMAVRTAAPMFAEGSDYLTKESSFEFFQQTAPANLKFSEMMYMLDPDNLTMLSTVIKGYAGLAYAVPETFAFGDELSGKENSVHHHQAIHLYTRALDYGVSYLEKKKISRQEILNLEEKKLIKLLNKKLDEDDHTAVLFFAQAWGSLINLQKDNIALVSHVPRVKLLFDWVCVKNPEIENGVCEIFEAQYQSSRPKMLGGNPELGKELFNKAIAKRPKHLLIRLTMLQFHVLPAGDKEAYDKEATILKEEFQKWQDLNRDSLENTSDYADVEHLHLFNAIAKKRFELIEKNKNKIF